MKNQEKKSAWQSVITILLVTVCVVAFAWTVSALYKSTGRNGMSGTIIKKEFIEQKETQISIGTQGVHSREVDGEYRLIVKVPETGKEYIVTVDPRVYKEHKVGGTYFFIRPPVSDPKPTPSENTSESQENLRKPF